MNLAELARIARAMVVKNKGILAADESTSTIKKRFDAIKLESTEEHRRTSGLERTHSGLSTQETSMWKSIMPV